MSKNGEGWFNRSIVMVLSQKQLEGEVPTTSSYRPKACELEFELIRRMTCMPCQ